MSMFQNIINIDKAPASNYRSEESRKWFRQQAVKVRTVDVQKLLVRSREFARTRIIIGQMYMFAYDPKHKDTLPYYDRYPLIFPFKKVKDGFLGINLHYLPIVLRAKLMDNLYDLVNNDAYDETTKLRLSYNILDSAAKFRYFKPCVKHYLNNQMDSKFYFIHPDEWEAALFLPTHKFKNALPSQVYKDSRNIIAGR